MRNRLSAALGVLLLSASLAHADHELHREMQGEPDSLDPQKVTGAPEAKVLDDLFEGLTALSASGEPIPGVATTWQASSDGLEWTFHLRPDAAWSNGDPLTAEDFVYSFRHEVDPATAAPYSEALSPLANADDIIAGHKPPTSLGVAAPDSHTLVIHLAHPTPWLVALLAHHSLDPVPRKAIEQFGDRWPHAGNIVSNGPYMLAAWVPHGEITLVRNPHFHDAASVRIATVHHMLADDPHAAVRRFEAGELDDVTVPGDEMAAVQAKYPDELKLAPALTSIFFALNLDRDDLKDIRVRRALTLAIDRDVLVHKVQQGVQIPALGLIPPGSIAGYTPPQPDWSSEPMPARIAEAKALMAAARGAGAPPLQLTVRTTKSEPTHRILEAVAAMWKTALGVETTIDQSEFSVLENDFHHGNYEVGVYGWVADYVDPWSFLSIFRSDAGALDIEHYHSTAYEGLLDQSRLTAVPEARMKLMEQAEAVLLADQPMVPIEYRVTQNLVSSHVQGWVGNPLSRHPSRYLAWKD